MMRGRKWALGAGLVAALLAAACLVAVRSLPTNEELAARIAGKITERWGVPVTIGSARWTLFPVPVVVLENLRTDQAQPITVGRIAARPSVESLLRRKLVLARVSARDAVLPSESVQAFRGAEAVGGRVPPDHVKFRNVTWVSDDDLRVTYDGEADFDGDWRPHRAELRRPGAKPPFVLAVEREGAADRWRARIRVGGGTMNGDLELKAVADGNWHLNGTLAPRDVEVADAVRTFERRPVVSGRGSGRTLVWTEGRTPGELLRALHTRTTFRIAPATVLRFNLDKAIDTLGQEHDGETPVDELAGQLDTQNTGHGIRFAYSDLTARSGQYSAAGEATTYRRRVEASGTLRLEDGAAVPFTISGPTAKPRVSVSKTAAAGVIVSKKAGDLADRVTNAFRRIFTSEE
jgi:uncharacterized protein involved in outer membrane biogenesis